jgi:glycosyltransferase involved in cell wall biosynthesis
MNILQTPPRIWTAGGVETYVDQLSGQLAAAGNLVTILCAGTGNPRPPPPGVRVVPHRAIAWFGNTPITPALPITLLREEVDIIHTHLPTPWSADWSRIIANRRKIPLVLTYHSGIVGEGAAGLAARLYNNTALISLLKRADSIIIARKTFMPECMRPFKEKITVIPIGVDISAFHPVVQERPVDIFFLSVLDRFHHFKGLDVLLEAVRDVSKKIPGVRVAVGGAGLEITVYAARARTLGIEQQVCFLGYIPQAEMNNWYNRSQVFVLPSTDPVRETFGIVLLEAMAAGRPVITTEIAGMAGDIRACDAGIVVPRNDVGALAQAIKSLLSDTGRAEQMGVRGRRMVEQRYQWPQIAGRIEEVYKKLPVEKY